MYGYILMTFLTIWLTALALCIIGGLVNVTRDSRRVRRARRRLEEFRKQGPDTRPKIKIHWRSR